MGFKSALVAMDDHLALVAECNVNSSTTVAAEGRNGRRRDSGFREDRIIIYINRPVITPFPLLFSLK